MTTYRSYPTEPMFAVTNSDYPHVSQNTLLTLTELREWYKENRRKYDLFMSKEGKVRVQLPYNRKKEEDYLAMESLEESIQGLQDKLEEAMQRRALLAVRVACPLVKNITLADIPMTEDEMEYGYEYLWKLTYFNGRIGYRATIGTTVFFVGR